MSRKASSVQIRTVVQSRRRWPRFAFGALLLVAVLIYFAPALAVQPPFRDLLFRTILPDHTGRLQVEGITAGWRSPVMARGVQFASSSVQLTASSVCSNRTVWDLIKNPTDLGRWQVDSFQLTLVSANRSSWVDAAAAPVDARENAETPGSPTPKQSRSFAIELHATGGKLTTQKPLGNDPDCIARDIEFHFEAPAASDQAAFRIMARTGDPKATAHCSAHGKVRWPYRSSPDGLIEAHMDLVGLEIGLARQMCELAGVVSRKPRQTYDRSWLEIAGSLIGSAEVRTAADRSLEVRANLEVQDFAFTDPLRGLDIRQPIVSVSAVAHLAKHLLRVDSSRVCTDGITVDGSGTIHDWAGQADADLSGSLACDWQVLKSRVPLGKSLLDEIDFTGCERRPWRLHGPLRGESESELGAKLQADAATHIASPEPRTQRSGVSGKLQADVATHIASLHVLGFDFGPVELSAHWTEQEIQFEPVELEFREGRVCVEPTISMRQSTPVLSLPASSVIQHVALDPKLCDWLLRYVDPLSTISSNLHGQISLELDQLEVPLVRDGLHEGSLAGRVLLENVQFSPDDSLRELFSLAGITCQASIRTSQTIDIRLKNGRVHHSGLALPIGDDQVTLDGWVGLDHSMNIRVSLPVIEQMLGKDKRLYRLLRGQRIEVPVTGTLENPKLNQEALARNIQRLVQLGLRDSLGGDDPLRGLLRRALK